MSSVKRRATLACAAMLLALVVTPAAAQTSPNELAIAKGKEGIERYHQGDYDEALALFQEADGLYHSPVLVVYAARSKRKLGRLLEARALFQSVIDEAIDAKAPKPWKAAKVDAATELAELAAEIPSVTIVLHGASPAARASLDDREVPVGVAIEIDPGEHRFSVVDGGASQATTLAIQRGERERAVELTLPLPEPLPRPLPLPAPPPLPPLPPTPPPRTLPPPDPAGPDGFFILAVTLASVGGAALVAGGVVGGAALGEASAAEDELPQSCTADRSCPAFEEVRVEDAFATSYALAAAADGLLIGGAVAAAAGIILLIVDPGADDATLSSHGLTLRF
jgi:tetratricopeptide (TPR) repeat protein